MNKVLIFLGGALAVMWAQHLLADDQKWDQKWWSDSAQDLTLKPSAVITLNGNGSRTAIIDFSGPEVQYRGDLAVSESAKIFFDAVGGYMRASCSK